MYCIGLMSGTSVDGIDAALVEISGSELNLQVELLAAQTHSYPATMREEILAVCAGKPLSMEAFAQLDEAIASVFADAANAFAEKYPPAELIGSHGQTVFHRPHSDKFSIGYSLQLGRGEVIAHLTGMTTVSDFRTADIAAGGQGAPLVSKIDACLLSHPQNSRCVQNIGGIGNVTYLPPRDQPDWQAQVRGWDTGPGNVLIDLAVQKLTQGEQTYDRDGNWAAQGTPCQPLIEQWLQHEFFQQPPPKSTGRELFGEAFLSQCWQQAQAYDLSQSDWLATVSDLTAASIADSYHRFIPHRMAEVLICGGGSRNQYLIARLKHHLPPSVKVLTVDEVGLSGEFKEAIAFAILAYWRVGQPPYPGNLPQVTGARQPMLLGNIHYPFGYPKPDSGFSQF